MPEYSVAFDKWIEIDKKNCELEKIEKDIATLENLVPRDISEANLKIKNIKATRASYQALQDEIKRMEDSSGNAGETHEERRKRLIARVEAEKASGEKAFLKKVAEEEGISSTRLKQLTGRDKKSHSVAPLPFGITGQTSPQKRRRKD